MKDRKVKLELRDMAKKYDNGDGVEHINLKVYEGEIVTFLGPSGCGKSTILRTIGGFMDVTDGDILVDGQSIVNMPPEKRPTAMVFQSYNLWPHMTIYENLAFGLKLRKVPKKEKKPATRQTVLAPDWKPSPELRIATAKAGVNLIREVTLFVAYYTQEKPEHRSANWDATYRRWLERDIQNLKMGRDPNNIALHPENLPTNGRLPKSMLNDMHNAEVQARAAAWDEAHPREEEFDEL